MEYVIDKAQQDMLKRRVDDVIYYVETVERFNEALSDANDALVTCLKSVEEDVVIAELDRLSKLTFNRTRADKAYQLLQSAYASINPSSIVGEM